MSGMHEIIEHIARTLWPYRYLEPWEQGSDVRKEVVRAEATSIALALGIDVRHWVQHDGARKRYFVITWTGDDK